MSLFLDRLHNICNKNGISPTAAAVKCGLTRQSYSHWKQRDSKPNATGLKQLSDFFGVPVDYFLDENYQEPPSVTTKPTPRTPSKQFFVISEKLTEREYCILQLYRTLSDADKSDITERLFRLHEKDTQ